MSVDRFFKVGRTGSPAAGCGFVDTVSAYHHFQDRFTISDVTFNLIDGSFNNHRSPLVTVCGRGENIGQVAFSKKFDFDPNIGIEPWKKNTILKSAFLSDRLLRSPVEFYFQHSPLHLATVIII